MAEIAMRKVQAGSLGRNTYVLVPVDQIGEEDFAKVTTKRDVIVTARSSINMPKWKLFQATIAKTAEAHPQFKDRDELLDDICLAVRHVRTSYNPRTGQGIISRKSTSPSAFTGEEFDRFFDRVWWYITNELLPEIPAGVLREEIEAMTSNDYDASRRPRR